MRNSKKRLALFASGRGSNGEALYKACLLYTSSIRLLVAGQVHVNDASK